MSVTFLDFINNLIKTPSLLITTILISAVMYINGCSDVPNAIATCVSTRSLTPKKALILASVFNFFGVLIMTFISSKVAETVFNIANFGNDTSSNLITLCSGLIGIVVWCLLAWYFGIPTSQSHSLLAGISGAAIALKGNLSGINLDEWKKVLFGLIVINLLAFFMGYAITKIIEKICKNMDRRKTNIFFKHTQILGALITCFMNGAQDGQKFIAILLLGVALSSGNINQLSNNFSIPIWLILYASTLIAIGTITGGLKIIKTIGTKVAKVERYQGTAADVSSAICLLGSSITGIPVSSTHTKNSAVMGVAASRRLSNVNWITARNMILTWIFTFPCCGLLGFVITKVLINVF